MTEARRKVKKKTMRYYSTVCCGRGGRGAPT